MCNATRPHSELVSLHRNVKVYCDTGNFGAQDRGWVATLHQGKLITIIYGSYL